MKTLCLLFILGLLQITPVNAQYFGSANTGDTAVPAKKQQKWGGLNNPRAIIAKRVKPAETTNEQGNSKQAKTTNEQEKEKTPPAAKKLPVKKGPALTDGMAERIAQMRGNNLSWADYEMYPYEENGSGYYIRRFELNDGMALIMGGPSLEGEPRYIYITDGQGIVIKALKDY